MVARAGLPAPASELACEPPPPPLCLSCLLCVGGVGPPQVRHLHFGDGQVSVCHWVELSGHVLPIVDSFRYLGTMLSSNIKKFDGSHDPRRPLAMDHIKGYDPMVWIRRRAILTSLRILIIFFSRKKF